MGRVNTLVSPSGCLRPPLLCCVLTSSELWLYSGLLRLNYKYDTETDPWRGISSTQCDWIDLILYWFVFTFEVGDCSGWPSGAKVYCLLRPACYFPQSQSEEEEIAVKRWKAATWLNAHRARTEKLLHFFHSGGYKTNFKALFWKLTLGHFLFFCICFSIY